MNNKKGLDIFRGHGFNLHKGMGLMPDEHLIPKSHVDQAMNTYRSIRGITGPLNHQHKYRILKTLAEAPEHERGGFFPLALGALLPLLGSAASTILPALGMGAVGAVGAHAYNKITGRGMGMMDHRIRRERLLRATHVKPVFLGDEPHFVVRGKGFADLAKRMMGSLGGKVSGLFASKGGKILAKAGEQALTSAALHAMDKGLEKVTGVESKKTAGTNKRKAKVAPVATAATPGTSGSTATPTATALSALSGNRGLGSSKRFRFR